MNKGLLQVALLIVVFILTTAITQAEVVFYDDFESGMGNWNVGLPPDTGLQSPTTMDWSSDHNAAPEDGTHSAYSNSSYDKMYHNLGQEIPGYFKATFYIYDDSLSYAYGEVRAYAGTSGLTGPFGNSNLEQLFAIGKMYYPNNPTRLDQSRYQARILYNYTSGDMGEIFFDLRACRSPGWHKFEIERTQTGIIRFYVDNILQGDICTARPAAMDCLAMGMGAWYDGSGNAWYDGVSVVVPEPGSLLALGSCLTAFAGFARPRRRSKAR